MNETDRRRRKMDQLLAAWRQDQDAQARSRAQEEQSGPARDLVVELIDRLTLDGDLEAFAKHVGAADPLPGRLRTGSHFVFLNSIVGRAKDDPAGAARVVADAYRLPSSVDDARGKITALSDLVAAIGKGSSPAPGMVPLAASAYWALQEGASWPPLYASSESVMRTLGWLTPAGEQAERYVRYREALTEMDREPLACVEALAALWNDRPFWGLDPTLTGRCAENAELLRAFDGEQAYGPGAEETARRNVTAVIGDLLLMARALEAPVGEVLGRPVQVRKVSDRTSFKKDAPYRADGHLVWALEGVQWSPSLRVWATGTGVAVGLHAGWVDVPDVGNWNEHVAGLLAGRLPAGTQFFKVQSHSSGSRLQPAGETPPGGECFVGRWYPGDEALGRADLADDVVATAAALQPLVDRLVMAAGGRAKAPDTPNDELAQLVERFLAERGYPTEHDETHKAARAEMAEVISMAGLDAFDVAAFRAIYNGSRYGRPGPQSVFNSTINSASAADLERLAVSVRYLLWGDDPHERRIDRVLDQTDLGFKGLGESVVMKLLAVAHPERYVPVFPYVGDMGKVHLTRLIGLDPPAGAHLTRGQLQVQANDLIRKRLEPYFPGDTYAHGRFLYWLNTQAPGRRPETDLDVLGELADELLVDRDDLAEIVDLLHDKGQVIFYGPPGTGKTFLAKKLAAALAVDKSRFSLVQFHPSTSYEDFFEGFRPELGADGQLTYRLVEGPLALLAAKAEAAPGVPHVMVIDEINRANLPKVFGELLFLLEYRNESARTLYRPEDAFELPDNLFFIGTMNTADRSIALVDAALRRRFHFIPFFPNTGLMAGLLRRWFIRHDQPAWVADLVDVVNAELFDKLGGPHLQLGPSHFMRTGLDVVALRRIWTYNVFPFIEEQLFGDQAEIERYAYDAVLARYRAETGATGDAEAEAGGAEPVGGDEEA